MRLGKRSDTVNGENVCVIRSTPTKLSNMSLSVTIECPYKDFPQFFLQSAKLETRLLCFSVAGLRQS